MAVVDIRMIPSKIAYFFFYITIGCIIPYLAVFLVSTGLTVREAGLIMGFGNVAGSLCPVLFGWIADHITYKRLLFISLFCGQASALFSLPFVAYLVKPVTEKRAKTTIKSYANVSNVTSGNYSTFFNSSEQSVDMKFADEFSSNLFISLLLIAIIARGFQFSFLGVLDSMTTNVIDQSETNENFGHQVMFSGLGVALGSIIAGAVTENFTNFKFSSYMGNFYTFLPFSLPLIPLVFVMYQRTSWRLENRRNNAVGPIETPQIIEEGNIEGSNESSESKTQQLLQVLKNPDNIVVMVSVFVCGLLRVISRSFLFLFMKEEMNASKTEMGLAEGIGSISLFLVYFISGDVIQIVGPIASMEIGLGSYCILLLATSFVRRPWVAIILQLLRGVGVGLFRSSFVKRTTEISPKDVYITLLFINICFFYGLPGSVGNFAGGVIYYQLKGAAMFQGTCVLGCAWLVFMVTYFQVKQRLAKQ